MPAKIGPKVSPLPAAPAAPRSAPLATPTAAPNGFTAPHASAAPVAGVTHPAHDAPPPPLKGERWVSANGKSKGTIYDAQAFLREKLKLLPGGELRLFHQTETQWATPEQNSPISTRKSGGLFGRGFYASTAAETIFGEHQFQLALPVNAFAGKSVLDCSGFTDELDPSQLPPNVDVLVHKSARDMWFIFKPGSERWVNAASTESNFDGANKTVAWD